MKLTMLVIAMTTNAVAASLATTAYVYVDGYADGVTWTVAEDTESGQASAVAVASIPGIIAPISRMTAQADYGTLHNYGSAEGSSWQTRIYASSSFSDSMVVSGGTGTGTITWTLAGQCVAIASICTATDSGNLHLLSASHSYQFQYGTPFDFGLTMISKDHGTEAYDDDQLSILSFAIENQSASEAIATSPTLSYRTASGSPYNVQAADFYGPMVHNPEPESLLLVVGGVLLISASRLLAFLRSLRCRVAG